MASKTLPTLILALLIIGSLAVINLQPVHATSDPTNVITNPSFENGVDPNGVPNYWQFTSCEGVGAANITQDPSQWTDGSYSAKITTGPITPGGCIAPAVLQQTTCNGTGQIRITCIFPSGLSNSTLIAYCMGMSGTGGTYSQNDTLKHTFTIQSEETTNTHVACGFTSNFTYIAYQQSRNDNITFNFGPNTLSDFAAAYELLGPSPVNDSGPCTGNGTSNILSCNTTLPVYGYPFILSMTASTTPMTRYTPGTNFVSTNITTTGVVQYSNSPLITTTSCQSTNGNTVDYGMSCILIGLNRSIGFSQFAQDLPNYNYTSLTDNPQAFSFWFKLEPANNNGIAAFEVRIFGGETNAELEYVFDPDPSVGQYTNITTPYYTYAIIFTNYKPGQWYHFSRDLHSDWTSLMPLSYSFNRVQFEGFTTGLGSAEKSETIWLDNIQAYQGNGQIPSSSAWTTFHFHDSTGTNVDSLIKWKLTDSTGQATNYNQGQTTLPPGPYYLQAYYKTVQPQYLVHSEQIRLNTTTTINLPMYANPATPGYYAVLNDTVSSAILTQPTNSTLRVNINGTIGKPYTLLLDTATQPRQILRNGIILSEGRDWTFNPSTSITILNYTTRIASENITVSFASAANGQSLPYLEIFVGTALAGIAVVASIILLRRRRARIETVTKKKEQRSNKRDKYRNRPGVPGK